MAKQITGITPHPSQVFTIDDPGGGLIKFRLLFKPRLRAWFIDIESNSLTLYGLRLVLCQNLLYQYRRNITFGLSVLAPDGVPPMLIDDFTTGRVEIYLLDSSEVDAIAGAF